MAREAEATASESRPSEHQHRPTPLPRVRTPLIPVRSERHVAAASPLEPAPMERAAHDVHSKADGEGERGECRWVQNDHAPRDRARFALGDEIALLGRDLGGEIGRDRARFALGDAIAPV